MSTSSRGRLPGGSLVIQTILILALLGHARAATYYVDDANGSDTNTGTSWAAAWKTLARAQNYKEGYIPDGFSPMVTSGATVYVKNGSYATFDEDNINNPRAKWWITHRTDWITYKAATGHHPTITGIRINNEDAWNHTNNGSSYLIFDGFTIPDRVSVANSKYFQVRNCEITAPVESYQGVNAPYLPYGYYGVEACGPCEHITIQGCDIQNVYRGVNVSGANDVTISGNAIHGFGEDGIVGPGTHMTISGNQIYDCRGDSTTYDIYGTVSGSFSAGDTLTQADTGATGIFSKTLSTRQLIYLTSSGPFKTAANGGGTITGPSGTISAVTCVDGPHNDAIQLHGMLASDILVSDNVATGVELKLATYQDGVITNVTFQNNLVRAGTQPCGDASMYMATEPVGGSPTATWSNVNFYNNTFSMRKFQVRNSVKIQNFHNNILGLLQYEPDKGALIAQHGHNLFVEDPGVFKNSAEVVTSTPGFVNSDNDFNLALGSAAIDLGDANYAPATDIVGHSRVGGPDAGAYEYIPPDPNNHPPVLASIGAKSVTEGLTLTFSVSATDADSDTLTYSVSSGLPSGATFSGQTFAWTPAVGKAGPYRVTFTVSDGKGGQDSQAAAITVSAVAGVNHPPVLASIGNKSVVKGNTLTFSVSATDADSDTLTYSATGLPTRATFSGQTFAWTPAYDQVGSYQVTFSVSDGKGGTDTEVVTIRVTDINHVPVLASIGNKSATVNTTLSFTVSATDADGDTLGYTTSPLPTGAAFANRTFNWTPTSAGSTAITFFVSDGQATASEAIAIAVVAAGRDTKPPRVSKRRPVGRIQAPTNTLVALEITDDDSGVDASSVMILVDNQTAYTGDTTTYDSAVGLTTRTGTATAYTYSLQPSADLGYDRQVSVIVTAADVAGNTMDPCTCSFTTEMRSFGKNRQVSSNPTNLDKAHAVTAADSSGNVWIAWQAGASGSRDIYAARLDTQTGQFGQASQLTTDSADQCNPAVAVSPEGQVYVVWQDYGRGNWDICGSRCADGVTWSSPTRLSDSSDQEVNPAIAIDHQSPHHVIVAWQDNRAGNDNIVVASADASLLGQTTWQVTSDAAAQADPALAIAADNAITVVWTDYRNGSADLYGASSSNSFGTNVALVTGSGNQTDPAIAIGLEGTVLHLVWVDDSAGNRDILYATFEGLPSTPLTGANIIDDTSGAQQTSPTIQVGKSGVFACWTDSRSVGGSSDADLYFADLGSGACRTNVLVGDEQTNTNQTEPALGVDAEGHPYVVWMDSRGAHTEIYYAGSTYVSSEPLKSAVVTASAGGTVGTPPAAIATLDDVSAVVPAGACAADQTIEISSIQNTPAASQDFLAAYDFGPSGLQFAQPVTVTVPYTPSGDGKTPTPCWYDPQTDTFSQDGISDVRQVVISSTLHAVSFKTTHFTQYYVAASSGTLPTSGGGGGGGCSVAPDCGRCTLLEFAIPYLGLAVVMVGLRLRDRRRRDVRA